MADRRLYAEFRRRVDMLIARQGVSMAAFARRAGLDRSTLAQLLDPRTPRLPRADTLIALARAGNVSSDWLLGLSQREETGSALVETVVRLAPYAPSRISESFLSWLGAAHGMRVCTATVGVPDFFKIPAALRLEYDVSNPSDAQAMTDQIAARLALMRAPGHQLEICFPLDALQRLAAGQGQFSALTRRQRLNQLERIAALTHELYPATRLYLYDSARVYSAPFTVFGTQRAALFMGANYLVFNAPEHIALFASQFDGLVRKADVQPDAIGALIDRLARTL